MSVVWQARCNTGVRERPLPQLAPVIEHANSSHRTLLVKYSGESEISKNITSYTDPSSICDLIIIAFLSTHYATCGRKQQHMMS